MRIDRTRLVEMLRTEGDNDRAEAVAGRLPEEIDTDRDADALADVGLDRGTLQAKLAAGSLGGNQAM